MPAEVHTCNFVSVVLNTTIPTSDANAFRSVVVKLANFAGTVNVAFSIVASKCLS